MAAEIRIFDTAPYGPPVLITLASVLEEILKVRPAFLERSWRLVGDVWGRGEDVCRWEESLQSSGTIVLDGAEIWRVLADEGQYVENGRFENDADVAFGIFDSSWIFVSVPDDVISGLESAFQMTERVG